MWSSGQVRMDLSQWVLQLYVYAHKRITSFVRNEHIERLATFVFIVLGQESFNTRMISTYYI